jgi:nitric oxide reductase activation protein
VRRQFGFIKPQSWRRVRRTSDGDELELDGVIEAVIDRRTGHASDSHLYVRRDRALREVAAAFLVDMSASTDFPLPEPTTAAIAVGPATAALESGLYLYGGRDDPPQASPAPRRRVIDVSKDALALMCDALQTLGDSYAIFGFSGDGRDNVEFHVAKDFADKLSARTWGALAAMQPRRSTRMGAAIRHALRKLARETARIKVLIIISDGYPEDHDYGTDRTDREYGIQDTARALWEAERAGVTDFCVTIDPAGHDYLRRMCRESRYLVIDDVASLPHELTKIYRTLTAC